MIDELAQEIDNVDDKPKKRTRLKKGDENYVNNAELLEAITEYRNIWLEYKESDDGGPRPPISNTLGGMIRKIAERSVYHPKYIKFPAIREEMVSDAIANCCNYCHNFNPLAETRSGRANPFGYITQICTNAFIQRIVKEKHQFMVKAKWVQSPDMANKIDEVFNDVDGTSLADGSGVMNTIMKFYDVVLPEHVDDMVDDYGNQYPTQFFNDGLLWVYVPKHGNYIERIERAPEGVELFFED